MLKSLVQIPVSWLYSLGVSIRHSMYDHHILPSVSVRVPTICVGNLAVGGTGKTPHVEYIVRLLLKHGYRVAVLSRGYKRKTHGFVLADDNSSSLTIGDEAMQLHTKFPEITVAVCESRVHGIRLLERKVEGLDVVVLDDAMQHRGLRSGLSILLSAYDRLYIDDHMLPWGTLRDLPSRAYKADMIVVTKCPDSMQPIDMRVIHNRLHLPTYQHLYFSGLRYGAVQVEGAPLILTGIAHPEYMIDYVQKLYPHAGAITFADHHAYTEKDITSILARAGHFDFVLTTEKDAQRLRLTSLESRLAAEGKQLVVLPIEVVLLREQELFERQILNYVLENTRR